MHGDKDYVVSAQDSKEAIKYLPKGSKIVIINGARHNFEDYVNKISSQSIDWFKEYL